MKSRGLMFREEMVQAILRNEKRQTRRLKGNFEVGDQIWVKETYASLKLKNSKPGKTLIYRADVPDDRQYYKLMFKWRPSMFMPKWASRLTLEVTAVRKERLKSISALDAIREGYPLSSARSPKVWYRDLWCQINGRKSWELNPVVIVITFRRLN